MKNAYFYYLLRRGVIGGGGSSSPVNALVEAFVSRVVADGGSVESTACLKTDLTYLAGNPEPVPAPSFTGLLNDYSGAAAAYSLRLLDNTYSGNAVRVRRASDNTEQDIGFANNELDTTSLETFCSGTDGFVTTWYDQSGNAVNAANATAANQPQIVSSGTSLGYVKTFNSQKLFTLSDLWLNGVDCSVFGVMKNTGNNLFISGSTTGFSAVSLSGSATISSSNFTQGNRYKNGSLIGATWGDMHNATTSFAAMSLYATRVNVNIKGSLGGFIGSYNNSELKEYIVYPNQTISRTGVETNIIDHYNF